MNKYLRRSNRECAILNLQRKEVVNTFLEAEVSTSKGIMTTHIRHSEGKNPDSLISIGQKIFYMTIISEGDVTVSTLCVLESDWILVVSQQAVIYFFSIYFGEWIQSRRESGKRDLWIFS